MTKQSNISYKQGRSIMSVFLALITLFTLIAIFSPTKVNAVTMNCNCVTSGSTDQTLGCWQETKDGKSGINRAVGTCIALTTPGNCFTQLGSMPGAALQPFYCNPLTEGKVNVWFKVPTLGDLIGNAIRLIFFVAGLYALILLLLGAFEWISSGGDEKKLESARNKIMNAIIGLVVMVAVLTLVIILEQVVFGGKVCLGISCPINMGDLAIIK